MNKGIVAFPTTFHHHIFVQSFPMPTDAVYWWEVNLTYMRAAFGMIILMLEGWDESKGVKAEIAWFQYHAKNIIMMEPGNASKFRTLA